MVIILRIGSPARDRDQGTVLEVQGDQPLIAELTQGSVSVNDRRSDGELRDVRVQIVHTDGMGTCHCKEIRDVLPEDLIGRVRQVCVVSR